MARAVEEDCAAYIVNAGLNCYHIATANQAGESAIAAATDSLQVFADSLSPYICQFINGFINTTNGVWLSILEAANKIIEAIKKALSDPRKLELATELIQELIDSILDKIEQIVEFFASIPEEAENFVTGQINGVLEDINRYVEDARQRAENLCENRKQRIVAKLQAKYNQTGDESYLERIEAINAKDCTDIVGIELGGDLEWPELPSFVFNLHIAFNALINSIDIRLPEISFNKKFMDEQTFFSSGVFESKIQNALEWTNNKIDAVNNFIEPFVQSYNVFMEFLDVCLSFDLPGILKWLLKLPKKVIDTYVDMAESALDIVQGILNQDPVAVAETWLNDKFRSMAQKIRERADRYDPEGIDIRIGFEDNFISEVGEFLRALKGFDTNIDDQVKAFIEQKRQQWGSIYGGVLDFACQIYGAIIGGVSYMLNIVTAEAQPLLSLMGLGAAMFAPPVNSSPDPSQPDLRMPINGSGSAYETFYKQQVGSVYYPLQIDENGAPIPINEDYTFVTPFPNGRYYVDPDRPILPFGYFAADIYGRQVYDENELPIRVENDQYQPNVVERPLIDPVLAARAEQPDITDWKRLVAVDTSAGLIRISPPEDDRIFTAGSWSKTITHTLEFRGIASDLIAPQPTDTVEGPAPGLNGAGGTISNDFYGSFWYTRTSRVVENVAGGFGLSLLGRDPGTFDFTLERSRGFYKYDNVARSIVFRVTAQSLYDGVDYKDWRDPLDQDKHKLFYFDSYGSVNHDNVGRIYLDDNGNYRFGLFDNNVALVLRPQDDAYPWTNYETPAPFEFSNRNTAELFDDMLGGKIFGTSVNLLEYTELVSGTTSVNVTIPKREVYPNSVSVHIKRPSDSRFLSYSLLGDNDSWAAPVSGITEQGEYEYYYKLDYGTYSGLSQVKSLTIR